MTDSEQSDSAEVAALRAKLPTRVGLCPEHQLEFFYPLADGEGPGCPVCSLEMSVYVREDKRS